VNGGEVGDEGEESLEDLELYVDTLRQAVVHRLDDSRDRRETACKAVRRWRELRAMVITLAFFVAQPMKTGKGGVLYASHLP
jgi:hypothetical protein